MPSNVPLSIFPSPSKPKDQNARQLQLREVTRNSREVKGLALHFVAAQPTIEQAKETVHHTSPKPKLSQGTLGQHVHKTSSTPNMKAVIEASGQEPFVFESPPRTKPALKSALKACPPLSTSSSSIYSKRTSTSTTVFSPASAAVETPITDHTSRSSHKSHGDSNSVFSSPPRSCIKGDASAAPATMDFVSPHRSHSVRSARTIVSRNDVDNNDPASLTGNASIFPKYDMTKPLSHQHYYPRQVTASPPRKLPERKDSGVVVPRSYECVPEPDDQDLTALWRASTRLGACGGRKTQLSVQQTTGSWRTVAITQGHRKLFVAQINKAASKESPMQLSVHKNNPASEESQLLSDISSVTHGQASKTLVFPHQAAIDALTAASNSPQAAAIAQFDPSANSKAAESLATEALADAQQSYTCELVQIARERDSVGTVSASYRLQHPITGDLAVTVARSVPTTRIYTSQTPQIRVTVHHPSATSTSEDTLALASIDLGRKNCTIDLPSIMALEAEYMLDTIIATLFTTAALESEPTEQHTMVFAAPPKTAVQEPKMKKKHSVLRKNKKPDKAPSHGLWPLRKTGVREIDEPIEEMPSAAKGALAILELGIHGAFWALERGFRTLDERATARH